VSVARAIAIAPRSELQELRDRVAELEYLLAITCEVPPQRPRGVDKAQWKLLCAFVRRPFLPTLAAHAVIWGLDADTYRHRKVLGVRVHQVRKFLRGRDIELQSTREADGYHEMLGWFLKTEDRVAVAQMLGLPAPDLHQERRNAF
jgi:hypothetical protein